MKISTKLRTLALLSCAALAAACGDDDPTGPEGDAQMSAAITDGGAGLMRSMQMTAGGPEAASQASGTMSGNAQVYVYSSAQGWVSLGSPHSVSIAMQSNDQESVATSVSIPAGTYTKARLVLNGFHADLGIGSVIDGITLGASVSITMGGADNTVEVETDITPVSVTADASATVVFDLNSRTWVDQENAESETASDAEIQAATTAHTEIE